MSEIPSDVSPALLESPTAHGAVLGGLCPPGAGMQQKSGWSFGRRFWLVCSEKTAQGTGLKDTQSPTSAPRLPWDAAPMQKPSQREVCSQQVRVGDGMCLKHKLQPTGDNQTAWGRETCSSS